MIVKLNIVNDNREIFEKILKRKAENTGLDLIADKVHLIEQVNKMLKGEEQDF